MDVSAVGSTASTASAGDRQLIADNLDTFLQLLTTQLKNQDPLEPLDTNEFTAQLVQYSAVEQDVKTNDLLEQLVSSSAVSSGQVAVSYIGKVVTADGATTQLSDGEAIWAVSADGDATEAAFTIRDSSGTVIYTATDTLESGTSAFTWDGTTNTGQPVEDGLYTLSVSARDAAGDTVRVTTEITGTVRGAEFDGSQPLLDIGGLKVKLDTVSAVALAPEG